MIFWKGYGDEKLSMWEGGRGEKGQLNTHLP